jgi:hypothetical protein
MVSFAFLSILPFSFLMHDKKKLIISYSLFRPAEKTQEARRVLLSDINFTSMVPELSRSADHLCQDKFPNSPADHHHSQSYYKGNQLKTPDYASRG